MHKFALAILVFSASAFGLGPEYKFDPKLPIDVVDLSYAGGQGSKRICAAFFRGPDGALFSMAMNGNDELACKDPANYKESGHVYVRPSRMDMSKRKETGILDGVPYVFMASPPTAIFRWVEKLGENSHRYEAVCQVRVVPDSAKYEARAPVRVVYCKNEGTEWEVSKDDQGNVIYGEDAKPLLVEVAICPPQRNA